MNNNQKPTDQYEEIFFLTDKPSENKESPDVFTGNMHDWTENISAKTIELAKTKKPVFVLLAGSSCSGKGEAINNLSQKLNKENLKVFTFSTDNFYKGISKMIMEQVLEENTFTSKDKHEEIFESVKNIIQHSEFDQKFSPENLDQITNNLQENYNLPPQQIEKIKKDILEKFSQIDFDNPKAVNLDLASQEIAKFKTGEKIKIPQFSMKLSEKESEIEVDPTDYDVVILEGIYALNEKISHYGDLKNFIEVPNRSHLLLRRLFRDVIGPKARTSFTPETALMINLKIVMPSAEKYILPTKKSAQYICENPHTAPEAVNTSYCEVQDKLKISKKEAVNIWQQIIEKNFKMIDKTEQKDHYIVDKDISSSDSEDYQKYILRIRDEKEKMNLVYKGPRFLNLKGKIIRPAETLVKQKEFGTHYQNSKQLLEDFKKSGFKKLATIEKKRLACKQNGIVIMMDQVKDLGYFIEFITDDEKNIPKINKLKKELGLDKHPSYGPYIDQLVQQQTI